MSASVSFRSIFTKKYLSDIYDSNVRYKSAVGIDRINTKAFEKSLNNHIDVIYKKTRNATYKFTQYREKLFSKGPSKPPRVISIPTIRDKITLKALFELLNSIYGPGPFLHEIINNLMILYNSGKYSGFLKIDVKDFYPSIKHDILREILTKKIKKKEILYLIDEAIKTGTVSKPVARNREIQEIGVPQGISISNILANIYMLPIDNKYGAKKDFKYFRYVDDILILCDYKNYKLIRDEIVFDLDAIGLKVPDESEEPSKVNCGELDKGFTYLGYKFYNSTVTVRDKSVSKLQESIVNIFTNYKYSKLQDDRLLQWTLNIRVTGCIFKEKKYGWMFFFSQINDLNLLFKLDNFIEKLIKRFGVDKSKVKLKRFVRSYYEITKRISISKYIPNFDEYTISEKRRILNKIFDLKTKFMSRSEIEYEFNKRIYRTIRDLERDLARLS
jgi:retron-type reverse transcriptase